jgi:hypothetical protein
LAASIGVEASRGPAASSAAVMAEIAISSGSAATTAGSCQSITTDVSRRPDVTSQTLIDQPVEISAESTMVGVDGGTRQGGDFIASDEGAPARSYRAQLGHRFTVAGDDERLACCYGIDDFAFSLRRSRCAMVLATVPRPPGSAVLGSAPA